MKLKIATYNIHKGMSTLGFPRVQDLKQSVESLAADVVFLQEVQGRNDKHARRYPDQWPSIAQYEYLANENQYFAYGKNAVYQHGHHGNALISAYPILFHENQDISDHAFESRGLLHCVVQTPSFPIYCYVVHLGLFERSRQRQTNAIIEYVNATAKKEDPVIIAGDFNDWGNHLSEAIRSSLGVKEVFDPCLLKENSTLSSPAKTFPSIYPCLPLDRIYVRGFKVHEARVMTGKEWAKISDHVPIVALLEID